MTRAKTRWTLPDGTKIIKYRFTSSSVSFLRYEKGQSLDGGDYSVYPSLKLAKEGK